MVVLVTGQFHDFINMVPRLAQALPNALEQGRFTVPRPPFAGGFEGEEPLPAGLKETLASRKKNVDLACLSHVLKQPRNLGGKENPPRCVLSRIAEHRYQTRPVGGHERQIPEAAGRQVNADQTTTVPVLTPAEVVVEMAHGCAVARTQIEHGIALGGQQVGRVTLGSEHAGA